MDTKFIFDDEFCKEEIRCDYLITQETKKIWSIELDILKELDRVCKKYNLRYFAGYGTLLGAVRHKGFIPWDDDIDIYMPRSDYEKLKLVGSEEFSYPYFYQNSYTDTIIWPFSKIRRTDTSAIQFPNKEPEFNQGIFIDIFPLDDFPDGTPEKYTVVALEHDLWTLLMKPEYGAEAILRPDTAPYKFTLDLEIVNDLLHLPRLDILAQFEDLCLSYSGTSKYCGTIMNAFRNNDQFYPSRCFEETILLPFENIEIPCPAGYDELLTVLYKDWHTPRKVANAHTGMFIDPETPYIEYLSGRKPIPSKDSE